MPKVLIGIGEAVLGIGAAIVGAVFGQPWLVGLGVTLALNGVTTLLTKPPAAASVVNDLGSSSVSVRQPLAPRQVTYGRDRRGGVFTYIINSGGVFNTFLNVVITMAGHQVTDIPAMYFDGVQIPVDANGDGLNQYAATDGSGLAFVHWEKKLGAPGEPAFPGLIAQVPSQWTVNHRQDGCASCYVRLKWDATLFPNGMPTITFDILGKPVFDPRTGLTAYSENVALCLRDYLLDPVVGLAESAASIDNSLLIAAANVCDQSVALRAGGSEPNFSLNGSFSVDQVPADIITGLLSAMAGSMIYSEGKWKIYAAAFRGTTIPPLTDNDLRDSMKVQTLLSRRDLSNCVKGVMRDPLNNWQPGDFPCVQNPQYICQDNGFSPTQNLGQWASFIGYVRGDSVFDNGSAWWCNTPHNSVPGNEPSSGSPLWTLAPERAWLDLALAYTISPSMAQRIAKIQLEKIRRQIDVQFPGRLNAIRPEVCDVIQITRQARFGWNAKSFEVYNAQMKVFQGDNGANQIGCDLGLRETDAAVYAWNPTVDETVVNFVGTGIQSAGGTTVNKYFTDGTEGVAGVQYIVSVVVDNQGLGNAFVSAGSSYPVSAPILPGATQNIDLIFAASGPDVQLIFQTALAADALNILAINPIIARTSNNVNLIPPQNRTFQTWLPLNGAVVTITQLAPTLPDMKQVGVPGVLVATNDTFTRADGVKKTRIKATWISPTDTFVLSGGWINLEVSDHADGSTPKIWKFASRVAGSATVAYYEEVIDGHTYDVRISSENSSGSHSALVEADGLAVSDAFSQITSTSFGNQGSIRPTAFPAWTVAANTNNGSGACTVRLTAPATPLPLTDGTSISMPAADFTWPGVLAASTSYMFAPRYKIADDTVHFAGFAGVNVNADPNTIPLASTGTDDQKNQLSVNQNFDGYIPLSNGYINVTTPNNAGAGGGSSGGDPGCVHEDARVELITSTAHGVYALKECSLGDLLKGRDLVTGEVRFRRIIRIQREACYDWYEVAGRLVTPCEPIWCEQKMAWVPAHEIGIHKIGMFGYKMSVTVEGQCDDDHNFVLMPKEEGQTEMIIHNAVLPRS
jgi:hypothetical protein